MVILPNLLFQQMVTWKHKQTEAEAVSFVVENHTLPYPAIWSMVFYYDQYVCTTSGKSKPLLLAVYSTVY